jgi:RNA polymerase sigma factor (sigma-70 family)
MIKLEKRYQFETDKDYIGYVSYMFDCQPSDSEMLNNNLINAINEVSREDAEFLTGQDFDEENDFFLYLANICGNKDEVPSTVARHDLAFAIFMIKINKYVYNLLHTSYPTYTEPVNHADFLEEMVQNVWLRLMIEFPKYNGQFAITTFCKPHILHEGVELIASKTNHSAHQNKIARMVKMEIDKISKEKNIPESDIPDQTIADNTGLSLLQVRRGREIAYDGTQQMNENTLSASEFESPESQMIQSEQSKMIAQALSVLSDLEQQIVLARSEGIKFGEIAERLADQIHEYGAKPTKNTVEQLYQSAIGKMTRDDSTEFGLSYSQKLEKVANLHEICFFNNEEEELQWLSEYDPFAPRNLDEIPELEPNTGNFIKLSELPDEDRSTNKVVNF